MCYEHFIIIKITEGVLFHLCSLFVLILVTCAFILSAKIYLKFKLNMRDNKIIVENQN